MNMTKVIWAIRAGIYSVLYGNISMPSYIGKPVFVSHIRKVAFGKRNRIYPGMRVELVGEKSKIIIGDNVSIGQNFHVVSAGDILQIGNDVTIAGNVFITNCDHDYKGPHWSVLENKLLLGSTTIGDGCFLGNNVVILAGTVLGNHCVVGSNSVVRGVYPDGCVIVGSPARIVKKLKQVGNTWELINDK